MSRQSRPIVVQQTDYFTHSLLLHLQVGPFTSRKIITDELLSAIPNIPAFKQSVEEQMFREIDEMMVYAVQEDT